MSLQGTCGGLTIIACDDVAILDEGVFQGEAAAINFTGGATATVLNGVATVDIVAASAGGSGTVTNVSVVTANGFKGSVTNPTTTPAITINASALPITIIAPMTAATILGNPTGSAAVPVEITIGNSLSFSSGQLRRAAIGGDITIGVNSNNAVLPNINTGIGTFGASASVPIVTVNAKGQVTAVSAQSIAIPSSQVTDGGAFGRLFFATTTTAAAQALIDASAKQNIVQFQDEGVNVGTAGGISTINFTGGAVTASATGDVLTVRCSAAGGGGTPAGSTGYIQYNTGGSFDAESDFFWDATNNRLGIGTSTPTYKLDIAFNVNGVDGFKITNPNVGAAAQIQNQLVNNNGNLAYTGISSTNFTGFAPLNGGQSFFGSYQQPMSLFTQTAHPIILYTNATEVMRVASGGVVTVTNLAGTGNRFVTANVSGNLSVFTTANAVNALGGGTAGIQVFQSVDATAARTALLTPGSVITGVSGATAISNMVSLTSGAYESIASASPTTLYFIT